MATNTINTLTAGLVKDTSPLAQKEGTYTFALNAILESNEGDYPFITNELGNLAQGTLPSTSKVIGKCLTDTDTLILFLVTSTTSIIGEYKPQTNSFVTLVSSIDLNFSASYPIKALFRIRKGCIRTIYFTDNNNPYRIIDIDDLGQYGSPINVNLLNLSRNFQVPTLNLSSVQDSGGSLKLGTYVFYIQYLDEDLNETA